MAAPASAALRRNSARPIEGTADCESGQLELTKSPSDYIPELKGSAFDRVTVQHVLDHATGLAFEENYVDPQSDFFLYYAPALNMGYLPGAADLQAGSPHRRI